jgi:hypothetical protein
MGWVKWKSAVFMLETFSPFLGTASFAWRFDAVVDFFAFDEFFLTGNTLTSVERGA